ncbi:MAG: hypothetical protein ACK4MV_03940 [Beijerinckiaceae bacterium]
MKRLFRFTVLTIALSAPAAAAESTGAPVCDEFLRVYEACVTQRTPEPERSEFLRGIELAREQYRRMASNRFKPDVAGACIEARKTVLNLLSKKYGCAFE